MANIPPYPHVKIDVEDKSIYEPISVDNFPLHKPIYFTRMERGKIGVPVWCDTKSKAVKQFGALSFDPSSKYFTPSTYFLNQTFKSNGAYIVRVADTKNTEARLVMELAVTEKDIPQYLRDEFGKFMFDESGEKIPVNANNDIIDDLQETYDAETDLIAEGTMQEADRTVTLADLEPSMKPGYELKWLARSLPEGADEKTVDFADLTPVSVVGTGNVTTTYYPMFTFVASNGGEWGNTMGFKLFYNKKSNANDRITRTGACYYSMAPMELVGGNTTASSIRNKYANTEVEFAIKPKAKDATTGVAVDGVTVLKAAYSDGYELPLVISYFPENFNTVGNLILSKDPQARQDLFIDYDQNGEDDWTPEEQGYMVNLFSNVDINGVPYRAVEFVEPDGVDADVVAMSNSAIHYLRAGADGDISDFATEEYIRTMLADTSNEYLIDKPRFPFNCMFDTGFSMDTKRAMISFLDVREDVKIYLGSQVSWADRSGKVPAVNAKYIDESVGAALREECLAMRESVAKGTGACRAAVFLHAGKRLDYDRWLPETLWIAIRKAEYLNRDFMNKEPKELPNSDVSIWDEATSWTATSEDTRERLWNFGLNYFQYYNSKSIHHASVRTVYKYDTSVLVDDSFTDAVIFVKQLTYEGWARFAGSTDKTASLQQRIKEYLLAKYQYMLHGKFEVEVRVYQTDEDVLLGYVQSIDVTLRSPGQNRVWNVNIICERDGFSSSSED